MSGGREFQSLGAMTEKALYPEMFGHMGWTDINQFVYCVAKKKQIK